MSGFITVGDIQIGDKIELTYPNEGPVVVGTVTAIDSRGEWPRVCFGRSNYSLAESDHFPDFKPDIRLLSRIVKPVHKVGELINGVEVFNLPPGSIVESASSGCPWVVLKRTLGSGVSQVYVAYIMNATRIHTTLSFNSMYRIVSMFGEAV